MSFHTMLPSLKALTDIKIQLPPLEQKILAKGIPMSIYSDKHSKGFVLIDWMFSLGYVNTRPELVPFLAKILFTNGTSKYKPSELREYVDFYGATLYWSIYANFSQLYLFVPNRYVGKLLQLVEHIFEADIMDNPVQFANLKTRILAQYAIQVEKNDYRAARELTKALNGKTSPYNYDYSADSLAEVEQSEVIDFFRQLRTQLYHIFIAGQPTASLLEQLEKSFAKHQRANYPKAQNIPDLHIPIFRKHLPAYREERNSSQVSIQMGCRLVQHNHQDFLGLQVLNTVLGGYFGSRLMQYIREEKGYTYGIYSNIASYLFHSNWQIRTQVNAEHRDQCIEDIIYCMQNLQKQSIDSTELTNIQNYLLKNLLKSLQTPLSIIHTYKQLFLRQKEIADFYRWADYIRQVTPQELQQLAQTYLQAEKFVTITALG